MGVLGSSAAQPPWLSSWPGEGELSAGGGEWERRHRIDARRFRAHGNGDIAVAADRYMRESLLGALLGVERIIIDRKQVAELQQLVILEQPALLDPTGGLGR